MPSFPSQVGSKQPVAPAGLSIERRGSQGPWSSRISGFETLVHDGPGEKACRDVNFAEVITMGNFYPKTLWVLETKEWERRMSEERGEDI